MSWPPGETRAASAHLSQRGEMAAESGDAGNDNGPGRHPSQSSTQNIDNLKYDRDRRSTSLRRALKAARRRTDTASVALLLRRLSDEANR